MKAFFSKNKARITSKSTPANGMQQEVVQKTEENNDQVMKHTEQKQSENLGE